MARKKADFSNFTWDNSKRYWKKPKERSEQYAEELKVGKHVNGEKINKDLEEKDKAFRRGYFQCQSDHAGVYRYKYAITNGANKSKARAFSRTKKVKYEDFN